MTMMRHKLFLLYCLLASTLGGCISQPEITDTNTPATVKTWGPILEVDGKTVNETTFLVSIPPGKRQILTSYPMYQWDYQCLFEFDATPGTHYEIIKRSNPQPLILYRWEQKHWFWAERYDPVTAVYCDKVKQAK